MHSSPLPCAAPMLQVMHVHLLVTHIECLLAVATCLGLQHVLFH
jgi:hypothetical protein